MNQVKFQCFDCISFNCNGADFICNHKNIKKLGYYFDAVINKKIIETCTKESWFIALKKQD